MDGIERWGLAKVIQADLALSIPSDQVPLRVARSTNRIVVGILLTYGTAAIMPKGMPFKLETSLVFNYSIILLVIAMLSSLVSVRKITKIDPLKALGRVE